MIEIHKIEREPRGYIVGASIEGHSYIAGIPCGLLDTLSEQQIISELESIRSLDLREI